MDLIECESYSIYRYSFAWQNSSIIVVLTSIVVKCSFKQLVLEILHFTGSILVHDVTVLNGFLL